jgi:hypothetical protein
MHNESTLGVDLRRGTAGWSSSKEFKAENCSEDVALKALDKVFGRN